jgi:hypothetical protein
MGFAASGDNTQVPSDSPKAVDARLDARPDAPFSMECLAASDCTSAADPMCCLTEHAGGELLYACAATCAQFVACAEGLSCVTVAGTPGTCTSMTFGPLQTVAWVCQ